MQSSARSSRSSWSSSAEKRSGQSISPAAANIEFCARRAETASSPQERRRSQGEWPISLSFRSPGAALTRATVD